jgi:hypothetical protein
MMQMLNALHGNPDPSGGFAPAAQQAAAPAAPQPQRVALAGSAAGSDSRLDFAPFEFIIDIPRTAYTHP